MTVLEIIDSGTRYRPITNDLVIGFQEDSHTYKFGDWNPPSVSHILQDQGINVFDPTYWRDRLMRKGDAENDWQPMSWDEAEEFMEMVRVRSAAAGTDHHAWLETTLLNNNKVGFDDADHPMRNHFSAIVADLGMDDILLVEARLANPVGMYCGSVDCLANTKDGITIVDWKTTSAISKAKRKDWQRYQLAAYMGTINRTYDVKVRRGCNVVIAPDGYQIYKWEPEQMLEAWTLFKGHLRDFWYDRCMLEDVYHSPEMANKALDQIEKHWGPFH